MDKNEKNIKSIINEYLNPIYSYVFRITGDTAETEDISQEIFIKVWKNINKIDPKQNFKTWIFTIARNTAVDWLRKRKNILFSQLDSKDEENERSFEETLADIEPLPDEIFQRKERVKDLEKALLKIRFDFTEILLLHYVEGMTFQEISEVIGKPLNTVKSQHRRALSALRKLLIP